MRQKYIFTAVCLTFLTSNLFSQNLNWVKQLYPFSFDTEILSSDSYLNSANVICGKFRDSIYFGFSPGLNGDYNPMIEPRAFVCKTDYDGNYLWHRTLDEGFIKDVEIDNNGNIIFSLRHTSSSMDIDPGTGVVNVSNGTGGYDHVVVKYSADGDYLWHKEMPVGGTGFVSLEVTSTNDVIVAGEFGSSISFAGETISCWGTDNTYIVEIDESGAENWVKAIRGTTSSSFSDIQTPQLDLDASGNIYIAGEIEGTIDFDPTSGSSTLSSGGNSKFFLAKYSPVGDLIFVSDQGTTDNGNLFDMEVSNSGEAILALDHDPTFGSEQGFTIRRCTATGSTAWEHIYLDAELNTYPEAVESDDLGNTYMAGKISQDTLDLDPTAGVDNMTIQNIQLNGNKGFVVKFGHSGQYEWSYHLDHLTLYNTTQAPTNFNNLKMIEPNSLFVTNHRGGATLFKLAVNGNLNVTSSDDKKQMFNVYPNPNTGDFHLNQQFHDEAELRIFDLAGTLIGKFQVKEAYSEINVNLPSGTYLLKMNNHTQRLIIQ